MAEIEGGGGGGHKKGGKPKGKKLSTRVDFTPMVDLGFLLITFFMLTTSLNKPKTMELNMPVKPNPNDPPSVIKASQAVTVLLTEKNTIVYYFVNPITGEPEVPQITDFSDGGIRPMLLRENKKRNPKLDSIQIYKDLFKTAKIKESEMKARIADIKAWKDGLIVVIKADDNAKFKNIVDILDEMLICNIGRYAIVDISEPEKELIKTSMATIVAAGTNK
ncbi:MAG: biopolymer transporter ExbD [Bacteroidota bacterium]